MCYGSLIRRSPVRHKGIINIKDQASYAGSKERTEVYVVSGITVKIGIK